MLRLIIICLNIYFLFSIMGPFFGSIILFVGFLLIVVVNKTLKHLEEVNKINSREENRPKFGYWHKQTDESEVNQTE